jgi:hypothetical protein
MSAATSLVELILKKWGDDAAKVVAPAAGVVAAGQSEDADAGFITKGGRTLLEAWHGSPHKFDKFSMDQIGTGEGAQAYGHGLYFADSEDVARGYRERLTKDGKDIVDIRLKKAGGDIDKAIADTEAMAEKYRQGGALSYAESNEEDLRFLRQFKETGQVDDGALYRTEIDVTPESLLDLDKPLNNQSDYVQERLQGIMGEAWNKKKESWTGRDYQRHWSGDYGDSMTSNQLLENGILGNRYLDGDHRGKFTGRTMRDGQPYSDDVTFPDERSRLQWKAEKEAEGFDVELDEGTSNYVIFDDSLINIAERGNADPRLLGGTAAVTAGALAAPALMKDGVFQHSATKEPVVERREPVRNQSSLLESVTDFGDEVIKSAKHAAGPLSLLVPYEGINDYLKVVNDDDKQPTWWDRLGLFDF